METCSELQQIITPTRLDDARKYICVRVSLAFTGVNSNFNVVGDVTCPAASKFKQIDQSSVCSSDEFTSFV